MALIVKPDISKIWAASGSKATPPDAKIASGWGYEMMPFEWENYLQNRNDVALNHINQRGVAEWDSFTEYQAGRSYVTGSNGVIYLAVTTEAGNDPTVDDGSNWIRAFPTVSGAGATGSWSISITGSAASLTTGRTIAMTGDVTWTSAAFNGSSNVTGTATLANSGVTAGTYNNVATQLRPFTVDAKGRITAIGSAITITPDWGDVANKPADLTAIASLAGTSGFLKKVSAGVWSLDTNTYALASALSAYAPLASPTFTGTPAAPTATFGTATTQLATTAFVDALRDIPSNAQTSNYTLVLADRGKSIDTTAGVIVPANSAVAFPIGSTVMVTNTSASNISISITTDTMRLAGTANTGTRTLAQYGVATLRKISSTVWLITGAGVT